MLVKKLGFEDWQSYRALRLEALSLHENVYGGSFRDEAAWKDSQWQEMFANGKFAFFGLYADKELVGIGAVFQDRADKTGRTALLAAGYVREDYRGHGYSSLLYEARIDWIVNSGHYDLIAVGHKAGNEASRRANQRFGFNYVGQEVKNWGDGSSGVIHNYEMRLR